MIANKTTEQEHTYQRIHHAYDFNTRKYVPKHRTFSYVPASEEFNETEYKAIAREIADLEESFGYNIFFKSQKPWKFALEQPVKLIKASTNKADMPQKACVCWTESGCPTWRFTEFINAKGGHVSHLELHERAGHTYINGSSLQGPTRNLVMFHHFTEITKQVFELVYNLEV